MSDILCAVCSEPWDQYGITRGDMTPWEAELFRKGAGCPCCEGIAPRGAEAALEDHLRSVVMESEDPDSFTLLHRPDAARPKWERPEDEIVFSCTGCDSQIKRDVDTGDLYWHTPTVDTYYHNRPGGYDWSTKLDELFKIEDKKYCPACATTCDDCSTPVFSSNESCTGVFLVGDTYDPGASHCDPRSNYGGTLCTDCLEKIPTCAYCSSVLDEDDKPDDDGYGPCCSNKSSDDDVDEDDEDDESEPSS